MRPLSLCVLGVCLISASWGAGNGNVISRSDSHLPVKYVRELNSEQHLVVDWTKFYAESHMVSFLSVHGLEVEEVLHVRTIPESYRLHVLGKFYTAIVESDAMRGITPFTMYLVRDTDPRYEYRVAGSRGLHLVNVRTHDVKKKLRDFVVSSPMAHVIGQGFHVTDHISETKTNLKSLGFYDSYYKKRMFSNMTEVFDALNAVPSLTYVVLRNFERFPDSYTVDEHIDVDLLVSDYFLAKRVLDGDGYYENGHDMLEDGGDKVLNLVNIGGQQVMFDLRYVGDNYYDVAMERDILTHRQQYQNFYIPRSEDLAYPLLYHALVHKSGVSNTYKKLFVTMHMWEEDEAELFGKLSVYLNKQGYQIVPPNDRLVGYFPLKG